MEVHGFSSAWIPQDRPLDTSRQVSAEKGFSVIETWLTNPAGVALPEVLPPHRTAAAKCTSMGDPRFVWRWIQGGDPDHEIWQFDGDAKRFAEILEEDFRWR
jgi:hypothetical protein